MRAKALREIAASLRTSSGRAGATERAGFIVTQGACLRVPLGGLLHRGPLREEGGNFDLRLFRLDSVPLPIRSRFTPMSTPPIVLTIAGSDSGGGAGIQADLKTFSAFQVYGASVLTAITAQNTLGVQSVDGISPEMVTAQFHAVASDLKIDGIKTGMLFSRDIIHALVLSFGKYYTIDHHPPIVVDPVCVSTSGHELLHSSAIDSVRTELIPWATVITPNIPEGELLAGLEKGSVRSRETMRNCAEIIGKLGCRWVLLKGGHCPEVRSDGSKWTVDLLWDSREAQQCWFERPFIDSTSTHGTGCTLSAALAAELGRKKSSEFTRRRTMNNSLMLDSQCEKPFNQREISSSPPSPPPSRWAADTDLSTISTTRQSERSRCQSVASQQFDKTADRFRRPNALNPRPFTSRLISASAEAWDRYVNHPFPNQLAAGTLPLSSFLYFLKQDYHFLLHYARTYALAATKSSTMEDIASAMDVVQSVVKETENHIAYCARYAISKEDLLSAPESIINIAYNREFHQTSSHHF